VFIVKVAILCGGFGTRLSEETQLRPKPMVEISGKPILVHIMNRYSAYGFNDFTLALGYKAEFIKSYFLNYHTLNSDFKVDLSSGNIEYFQRAQSNWKVSLVDTGLESLTGGRVARLKPFLESEKAFFLTYGDGLADLDLTKLAAFHKSHGKIATITTVRPNARFGEMILDEAKVVSFKEKPQATQGWINGGFFVFDRRIFDYFKEGDQTVLEGSPLENLAKDGQLMAYKHEGFWQCMDSVRDRNYLEELSQSGQPPWVKVK
jgi:glucose-1-phosphate cytidylyltransferase